MMDANSPEKRRRSFRKLRNLLLDGIPGVLLHHTGAKTGQSRITPLCALKLGERYFIPGSFSGRPVDPPGSTTCEPILTSRRRSALTSTLRPLGNSLLTNAARSLRSWSRRSQPTPSTRPEHKEPYRSSNWPTCTWPLAKRRSADPPKPVRRELNSGHGDSPYSLGSIRSRKRWGATGLCTPMAWRPRADALDR